MTRIVSTSLIALSLLGLAAKAQAQSYAPLAGVAIEEAAAQGDEIFDRKARTVVIRR